MPVAFDFASISDHWIIAVNLLLDFALKGTAIILGAGLLVAALRRASAATRHLVLSLSMVSLLALPIVYVILPEWHASILPAELVQDPARRNEQPDQNVAAPRLEVHLETQFAEIASSDEPSPNEADQASPAVITRVGATELGDGADDRPPISLSWSVIAVVIWVVGLSLVLVRLLVGALGVWRLTRNAEPLTDALWTDLAKRLSTALGLEPGVALLQSERVAMPLTCGALRPAVLMPMDSAEWSLDRRRVVLTHELAHVKRRDCLTQMLANLVCALYWFNPVVWIAARQLRIERERACDDCVLESGMRPSDYAGHLLELARSFGDAGCSTFAAVAIARRSQLEGRVLAILDPHLSRRPNRTRSLFMAIAIACVSIPLGAVRLTARANDATTRLETVEQTGQPVEKGDSSADAPATMLLLGSTPARQPGQPAADRADDPNGAADQSSQESESESGAPTSPEPALTAQGGSEKARAVEALREALKDVDEQVRHNAMSALAHIRDKSSVDDFTSALKDQNPQVRARAAWALGLNGDASGVEALIEAIGDESGQVRAQAAWALGLQGDSRAVEPLIAALKDREEHVRSQAAWALGLKGDHRAVEALVAALKDSSAHVRSQAAWALGLKGDKSAVEALIDALKDSSSAVRSQAAWALGMKGDRRASDALNAARKDDDRRVRQQAGWALGMILIRHGGAGDDDRPDKDNDGAKVEATTSSRLAVRAATDIRIEGTLTATTQVRIQGPITTSVRAKPVVRTAPIDIK
jgi:HEAT repeat protein/beta-lactamase regulating signal transducer with metallopeptidase domain